MQKVGTFSNSRGFTIVELLIVIVIIGILASLVIAAYNGIQDRANNQQTETAVAAYRKALIQYATDNRSYPITGSACLNEAALPNCWAWPISTSFNNAIRPYMGNTSTLPSLSPQQIITTAWGTRVGGSFFYNTVATLDGALHPYYIGYNLKGTGACKLSGVLSHASGAWTNFSTTSPASSHTHSTTGASFCAVALPDPATL